jgi:aldehyde:ferredoxin oxidoreductase
VQPILRINLTNRKIDQFEIPIEWEKEFLGGSSLAARILFDELSIELDPLSPSAPLLFLNGPLTGTYGPSVGRFVVCGKSPATNIWAESNCGGFWGPELKKVGYDGVYITGKADKPVFLYITDDEIQIKDASDIWGMDTYQVQDHIKEEFSNKKIRVASIGKAGENLIPSANIMVDHGRVAGRTGLGAVMGSKLLKCIAVFSLGKIPIPNEEKYIPIRNKANRNLSDDNFTKVMSDLGTAGAADYFDYLGSMPKKYYSSGVLSNVDQISGYAVAESILVGKKTCHGCVISCGREVKLRDENETRKGSEYETTVGFGPNLMLTDPEFSTRMGEICDRYGMDTITTSGIIGYAIQLFEAGRINKKDTDGLELRWGDKAVIEQMLNIIAQKKGFGEILAKGTLELERKFGEPGTAMQVNGLELAYHDPRAFSGMALAYATSPRGACHNQSDYYFVEIGQAEEKLGMKFYDRHVGSEKAENVAIHQNWRTLNNSIVMCLFANIGPTMMVEILNAALDLNWTIDDMLMCGERGWNLKRLLNNKLGITREDDKLPKALFEPLPDGGGEGYVIPFEEMLKAYYSARSWDWGTGRPSDEKIAELGLDWANTGELE